MIVLGDKTHGYLIATRAGALYRPDEDVVISREDENGKLLGGVVIYEFTGQGGSCSAHFAGFNPGWISRNHIWATCDYVFRQLSCRKLFGRVPSWNTHALEVDKKLGFTLDCIVKDVYPGGDAIVVSMRREDCRWLNLKPRNLSIRRGS